MRDSELSVSLPVGEDLRNPPDREIARLILETDAGFWEQGCGQMCFTFQQNGRHRELIVTAGPGLRMHLNYLASRSDVDWHVAVTGTGLLDPQPLWVGGEEHLVPPQTLVPRDLAWTAVKHFVLYGDTTPAIQWVRRSAIEWPWADD